MSFYDVDFDQQARDLLPPDKRANENVALVQALLKGAQWARDLILGTYKTGSSAPQWAAGTYNKYDQVIFKKGVYYSLIANNTANPDDKTAWKLIQPNFIGVDERVKFNGQSIVLEYALNKRFGGTFRPPPSASPSDINFQLIAPVLFGFRVGQTIGSTIGQTNSSDTIGSSFPFVQVTNFQINFLSSLYVLTNDEEIRGFVDLYIPVSINYSIVPY